jgi:hypothetical protein
MTDHDGSPFALPPFDGKTPYDVLGMEVEEGVRAAARQIGKVANKTQRKAKRIKDTKERAKAIEDIEEAKDRLIRPDDRVMVDFFLVSRDVVGDVCKRFGEELVRGTVDTESIIGSYSPRQKYDDLVPAPLVQFQGEFDDTSVGNSYDAPRDDREAPLPLVPNDG